MDPITLTAIATIGSGIIQGLTGSRKAKLEAKLQREQMQLERDKMALSDQQFAAKYGFDKADAEAEMARFNREQGFEEQKQAIGLQNQINRAPLSDKAQAMLMARLGAAPQAFQGRDMTRTGTAALRGPSTDPMSGVLATMRDAAANYKRGDGGVDMSLHEALVRKLSNPQDTRMPNAGDYRPGKGYEPPPTANWNTGGTSTPPAGGGGGGSFKPGGFMDQGLDEARRRIAAGSRGGYR